MKKLVLFITILCFSIHVSAQQQPSPILFIYDASGSMWAKLDGKTKKAIASEGLSTFVKRLSKNQNIGLMAYGHRKKATQ